MGNQMRALRFKTGGNQTSQPPLWEHSSKHQIMYGISPSFWNEADKQGLEEMQQNKSQQSELTVMKRSTFSFPFSA